MTQYDIMGLYYRLSGSVGANDVKGLYYRLSGSSGLWRNMTPWGYITALVVPQGYMTQYDVMVLYYRLSGSTGANDVTGLYYRLSGSTGLWRNMTSWGYITALVVPRGYDAIWRHGVILPPLLFHGTMTQYDVMELYYRLGDSSGIWHDVTSQIRKRKI
jgi:hypothetical protein